MVRTSLTPSLSAIGLVVSTSIGALMAADTAVAGDGYGAVPAGTTIAIGAQAIVQPKYEGGKDYEVIAVPIFKFGPGSSPLGSSIKVDFQGIGDVGIGLLNVGGFSAGPALGYRFDREEDDGRLLRGLGDVDGGLLVGGFVRYDFKPAYVRASYLTQVTGEEDAGGILRLQTGAEYFVGPKLLLKPFAAVEFGDDDYMQTYFGVTPRQNLNSGLRTFDAEAGAKTFHFGVVGDYEIYPSWTLTAGVEYIKLLGDAADSPVVEQEDQVIGRIGLSKWFTIGN